jgi:hypothetical protein
VLDLFRFRFCERFQLLDANLHLIKHHVLTNMHCLKRVGLHLLNVEGKVAGQSTFVHDGW